MVLSCPRIGYFCLGQEMTPCIDVDYLTCIMIVMIIGQEEMQHDWSRGLLHCIMVAAALLYH